MQTGIKVQWFMMKMSIAVFVNIENSKQNAVSSMYILYIYIYIYGIHMNNNVYLCYDGTTHKQSIFLLYFN